MAFQLTKYLTLGVLALAVASCAFSRLEDDLELLDDYSHRYEGTVSAPDTQAEGLILLALTDPAAADIAAIRVLAGPSTFDIGYKPVPLWFFVFADENKDLVFQANEPYGWANGAQAVDPASGATDNIEIEVATATASSLSAPVALVNLSLGDRVSNVVDFQVGNVTTLDNPLFSEEQAQKGLWEPFAFMADGSTGIHFLEEYDPGRIPVLFVHGINGTPRNFTTLIENLDTTKYQAWVYSYPSGLRLGQLAFGLQQFLGMVWLQTEFTQLHVVAHSMGGLVSRGALNLCVQDDDCVTPRSYTTISTPWNGVASAKAGVEWAPTVVPVWRDIDPDSEYVTTLFNTPLPPNAPFNLLFGFRQDSIFGSESSDGVIKLTSQLRPEAQEQAAGMRGYDEDHVSILSNQDVLDHVYGILDSNSL